MHVNPKNYTFGVISGKLLGYVISLQGIEVDPSKIKVTQEIQSPKIEKEIQGFMGYLQYITCFITKLAMVCERIFKKLKKGTKTKWDPKCQGALDKIKENLYNPPVIMPSLPVIPIIVFLTMTYTAMKARLA